MDNDDDDDNIHVNGARCILQHKIQNWKLQGRSVVVVDNEVQDEEAVMNNRKTMKYKAQKCIGIHPPLVSDQVAIRKTAWRNICTKLGLVQKSTMKADDIYAPGTIFCAMLDGVDIIRTV